MAPDRPNVPPTSPSAGLPPRQRSVYEFVRAYTARAGYPPSVREIMAGVGFRSLNSVVGYLRALEARGLLRRSGLRSRALAVPAGGLCPPVCELVRSGRGVRVEPTGRRLDLRELFGGRGLFAVRYAGPGLPGRCVAAGDLLLLRPATRRDRGRTVAAIVGRRVGLAPYDPDAGEQAGPGVLGVLVGVLRTIPTGFSGVARP